MARLTVKLLLLGIGLMVTLSACLPHQQPASTIGGAMGGIAGAILDQRNPWRGGIIGATLGAIAGATIADVSVQGARQAAMEGKPVEYRTENSRATYYAEPLGYDNETQCRRVREKTYVDGRLVRKRVIDICEDKEQYGRHRYRYDQRNKRYEYDPNDY